jgi:hypothetical protein
LRQRAEVLEQDNRRLSEVKESRQQSQAALGLSTDFSGMVAVSVCVGDQSDRRAFGPNLAGRD